MVVESIIYYLKSFHPLWLFTGLSKSLSQAWVNAVLPDGVGAAFVMVFSTVALTAGLGLLVYILLRKIVPSFLGLFTGGR